MSYDKYKDEDSRKNDDEKWMTATTATTLWHLSNGNIATYGSAAIASPFITRTYRSDKYLVLSCLLYEEWEESCNIQMS